MPATFGAPMRWVFAATTSVTLTAAPAIAQAGARGYALTGCLRSPWRVHLTMVGADGHGTGLGCTAAPGTQPSYERGSGRFRRGERAADARGNEEAQCGPRDCRRRRKGSGPVPLPRSRTYPGLGGVWTSRIERRFTPSRMPTAIGGLKSMTFAACQMQ